METFFCYTSTLLVEYTYVYFHSDEIDCFLEELRKENFELEPKFRKYRYTEIMAKGKDCVLGKCDNINFLVLRNDVDFKCQVLHKTTFKIVKADENFVEFLYGKFKIEDDLIKLDSKFDENLFYDLIPALQIQIIKSEILIRENDLRAKTISNEESKIIKEIVSLSEIAKKTNSIEDLENILNVVSTLHVDFFKKFIQYKDINEEIFTAITRFEVISRKMGDWFIEKKNELKGFLENLKYFESKFEQTLGVIRDLFSLISIRLDMLRNREYMEMQKKTSSLQAAAVVIEFVAVFYYSLKVWEHFMHIDKMPRSIAFILLSTFTTSVVAYTEILSEVVRKREVSKRFIVTTLLLILIFLLMYFVPLQFY